MQPDKAHTVAKRYKLREGVIPILEQAGAEHGSVGRAIQVAAELLAIRAKPLAIPKLPGLIVGKTYKLAPRTIRKIDKLASTYRTRGNVLAACAHILTVME